MQCPCESGKTFKKCCEPFITGEKEAETAEQLMRSRYTAYTQVEMDYIEKTHDPKTRNQTDMESNRKWAESTKWTGLEILGLNRVVQKMKLAASPLQPSLKPTRGFKNTMNEASFAKKTGNGISWMPVTQPNNLWSVVPQRLVVMTPVPAAAAKNIKNAVAINKDNQCFTNIVYEVFASPCQSMSYPNSIVSVHISATVENVLWNTSSA